MRANACLVYLSKGSMLKAPIKACKIIHWSAPSDPIPKRLDFLGKL